MSQPKNTPDTGGEYVRVPREDLEKLKIKISGGLCYFTADAKHAQLSDAMKAVEAMLALSSIPSPARDADTVQIPMKPTPDHLDALREGLVDNWRLEFHPEKAYAALVKLTSPKETSHG